jgi:hypothetical protein
MPRLEVHLALSGSFKVKVFFSLVSLDHSWTTDWMDRPSQDYGSPPIVFALQTVAQDYGSPPRLTIGPVGMSHVMAECQTGHTHEVESPMESGLRNGVAHGEWPTKRSVTQGEWLMESGHEAESPMESGPRPIMPTRL